MYYYFAEDCCRGSAVIVISVCLLLDTNLFVIQSGWIDREQPTILCSIGVMAKNKFLVILHIRKCSESQNRTNSRSSCDRVVINSAFSKNTKHVMKQSCIAIGHHIQKKGGFRMPALLLMTYSDIIYFSTMNVNRMNVICICGTKAIHPHHKMWKAMVKINFRHNAKVLNIQFGLAFIEFAVMHRLWNYCMINLAWHGIKWVCNYNYFSSEDRVRHPQWGSSTASERIIQLPENFVKTFKLSKLIQSYAPISTQKQRIPVRPYLLRQKSKGWNNNGNDFRSHPYKCCAIFHENWCFSYLLKIWTHILWRDGTDWGNGTRIRRMQTRIWHIYTYIHFMKYDK